ncbi:MAG: protein kinase [Alphaproteobacteria bacterium]|nr:protein kinase [Alphaproteobacteria bacterium]
MSSRRGVSDSTFGDFLAAPPVALIDLSTGTMGTLAGDHSETMWGALGDMEPIRQQLPERGERFGGDDDGRFEVLSEIGSGGMGVVFLVRDTLLERRVAAKFISLQGRASTAPDALRRLRLEARASARLNHENLVRVFDLGSAEGVPFLIMEYLEGESLAATLRQGRMDAARAVRVMIDVARGLAHAHRLGVLHRDLKPGNVFLAQHGQAKILDFGLADFLVPAGGAEIEGGRVICGTPTHMAPEQWTLTSQDSRVDIWAAGVMLFEMLTGRLPFDGADNLAIRDAVLDADTPPSVKTLRPDLPDEAERLIARTLQRDPDQRMGTAEELLDALVGLELALQEDGAARGPTARPAVRRRITLLSCSPHALMERSGELGPDGLAELLERMLAVVTTVVRELDGTVVSVVGGQIVVSFGWPDSHEDDAHRALRAATLIAQSVPGLRFGVHADLVLAAQRVIGEGEQTVLLGEAPYVAALLEGLAEANDILVSDRTLPLLSGQWEIEEHSVHTLDSADRRMEVFRVLGQRQLANRFELLQAHSLTPLVGRDSELASLLGCWARATDGVGQLVEVRGPAGIGKSRLVWAARAQLEREGPLRLSCQCWPQHRNTALRPILEGMLRSMGVNTGDGADEVRHKVMETLRSLGLDPQSGVGALLVFLGLPLPEDWAAPVSSPDLLKKQVMDLIVSVVLASAEQHAALVIVEDLHWADASTLELLELLSQRAAAARLMVLTTSRPEFTPSWPVTERVTRLTLTPLSSGETAALAVLRSTRKLPKEVVDAVVSRAAGVPLFIEELVRMVGELMEQGEVTREVLAESVPETLSGLLAARLDRLGAAGREVVGLAAVLGRDFSWERIAKATFADQATLQQGLHQLVEAGILRPRLQSDQPHYVFRHALLHDAALNALPRDQYKQFHLRAATSLEEDFPDVAEQNPEILGHHYARAGQVEPAIAALQKAASRAVARSAGADAAAHYQRAIELLLTLPAGAERDRRELTLRLALGAPLMGVRGYANPEVHQNYARARELCLAQGDDARLFPSVLGLWQFYMVGGEAEASARLGRQLLGQATAANQPVMLMLAHRGLGTSLMLLGDIDACRGHCEAGLTLYDPEAHGGLVLKYGQDPAVTCGLYLGWCLWFLGHADAAVREASRALETARRLEHPLSIAFALNYLATVHNYRGEYDIARAMADEALAVSVDHKLALWEAMSHIQRGWSLIGSGARVDGAEELKSGVAGWTATGARAGLTFFLAALVWGLWRSDQLDEAMSTIEQMEAFIAEKKERFFESELLRLRGEVTLSRSPTAVDEAERCYRRGLEVARAQKARAWELRLATSYGRLLLSTDRAGEVEHILGPALDWFAEGLETADLIEARRVRARAAAGR